MELVTLSSIHAAAAACAGQAAGIQAAQRLQILSRSSGLWALCDRDELYTDEHPLSKLVLKCAELHAARWGHGKQEFIASCFSMLRSIVLLSATQGKTRQRAWCNRVLWQHAASMEAIQARVAEATELPKNSPRESGLSKLLCQQVLAGALQADECMVAASHIVSFFFKLGVGSLAQHCQAVKAFPCSVVSAQASHGAIVWAARGPGGLAAESCGNIFIPCTLSQRPLPKPASQRSQRPRLLFVDLDEEWNESAQQLQAAAGLQVTASTLAHAADALVARCAAAQVTDLLMPGACPMHIAAAAQMHAMAIWDFCDEGALQWVSSTSGHDIFNSARDFVSDKLSSASFEVASVRRAMLDRSTASICISTSGTSAHGLAQVPQLPLQCVDKLHFVELLPVMHRALVCAGANAGGGEGGQHDDISTLGTTEAALLSAATQTLAAQPEVNTTSPFLAVLCRALQFKAMQQRTTCPDATWSKPPTPQGMTAAVAAGMEMPAVPVESKLEVMSRWRGAVAAAATVLRVDALLAVRPAA